MRDDVRAKRHTFGARCKFNQSFNRAKFLRQKRIPKTDRTRSVHGSYRLLRSCKNRDDRDDISCFDSNVEHRKHRTEREFVSTESAAGRRAVYVSLDRIEKNEFAFQINVALRASTSDSIVISDELDRGTSEISGLSLVAAVLNTFAERGSNCPHVFAATHAYNVLALLPQTPVIETQVRENIFVDSLYSYTPSLPFPLLSLSIFSFLWNTDVRMRDRPR